MAGIVEQALKETDPEKRLTVCNRIIDLLTEKGGGNVAADFGKRFAAEIRLPEALEEKLLCPFHYFGVADPVAISDDRFWKNGRYDEAELEKVYTGDHFLARQRLETVLTTLGCYE